MYLQLAVASFSQSPAEKDKMGLMLRSTNLESLLIIL